MNLPLSSDAVPGSGRPSILLVEDNRINQRIVVLMLGHLGVVPKVASSGEEALHLINHTSFDLVLMDLHMPGIDGLETSRLMRESLGENCPPIIALTADLLRASQAREEGSGIDGILPKPINTEILRRTITEFTGYAFS